MPDRVKEKLVDVIVGLDSYNNAKCQSCRKYEYTECDDRCFAEVTAGYLIANGVTVQEEAKLYWKPVKPGEWNLTCSACDSHLGCREDAKFCPECGAKFVYPKAVSPKQLRQSCRKENDYG